MAAAALCLKSTSKPSKPPASCRSWHRGKNLQPPHPPCEPHAPEHLGFGKQTQAEARLILEASARLVRPSSRGLWGCGALRLPTVLETQAALREEEGMGPYPSELSGAYHGSMRSVRSNPDLVVMCRASLKWLMTWNGLS